MGVDQLGASLPRNTDKLVILGLYHFVKHPMYAAAPYISLGLACLTQSLACLGVFCIYLGLISLLIPIEEKGLQKAHGKGYCDYQHKGCKKAGGVPASLLFFHKS